MSDERVKFGRDERVAPEEVAVRHELASNWPRTRAPDPLSRYDERRFKSFERKSLIRDFARRLALSA